MVLCSRWTRFATFTSGITLMCIGLRCSAQATAAVPRTWLPMLRASVDCSRPHSAGTPFVRTYSPSPAISTDDELRSRSGRQFSTVDDTVPDTRADATVQHAGGLHYVRTRLRFVAKGDRRALLLYVVKEMSYEEIAQALGVSLGAVKSRIRRAREALKSSAPRTDRVLAQGRNK